MTDIPILLWLVAVAVLGLNGVAAGAAAALHIWRPAVPRGGRVALAAAVAGVLPASIMILALVDPVGSGIAADPFEALIAFAALFGVGLAVSLPGAWVITRKLAGGGDVHRAFE